MTLAIYWRTRKPSRSAWYEGWWPLSMHSSNEQGELSQWLSWWQHHEHYRGIVSCPKDPDDSLFLSRGMLVTAASGRLPISNMVMDHRKIFRSYCDPREEYATKMRQRLSSPKPRLAISLHFVTLLDWYTVYSLLSLLLRASVAIHSKL